MSEYTASLVGIENYKIDPVNYEQFLGLKLLCYNGPLIFNDGLPYNQ